MGQHTRTPNPPDRKPLSGKRRWTAVAAGAAVVAAASTTAWAAIGNDDAPAGAVRSPSPVAKSTTGAKGTNDAKSMTGAKPTTGAKPLVSPSPEPSATSSAAAKPSSPAPKPPAAAVRSKATQAPKATRSPSAKKPKFRVLSSGACGASYYGDPQMTASGERFDPAAMTAAHKTLPLGSKVRVINPDNGDSVTVRINDRGPYIGGRCLDLSKAAFAAIGDIGAGVMRVKYEVLTRS
ncbi:septal ring lytic transglycosylase RlpA family protein [Nonomuraea sp. NPDC050643]|uniref:septal ring lytic transglycosylase RlpA family protein n=1 Tax=Nonomuraea sp. NPDC050643 TaxID=3155660 RepID=UPI00340CB8F4